MVATHEFSTRTIVFVDNYVDNCPQMWKNRAKMGIFGENEQIFMLFLKLQKNPYNQLFRMCIIKP